MGSTRISSPQPPPQPTVGQSLQDWVTHAPAVFAEQQRQAPLEAQQNLQLLQQFGLPMAQAYQQAQEALYPTENALRTELASQAQEGMKADMPQWARDRYLSDVRANLGTNVGSGIAADYTSRGLMEQNKQWQDYYRGLGSSLAGAQPVFQAQQPETPNYTQGFSPNAVMGFNSANYGPYASAYASMYGTNANYQNNMFQNYMKLGQMGAQGIGAFMSSSIRYKKNIKIWGKH